MAKIKTVMGFLWSAIILVALPLVFISSDNLARKLVYASGMKISPVYTGGDVAKTIEHADYTSIIHKPVFACLAGETQKGFVQIVWRTKTKLPVTLVEKIDIDGDEKEDFTITFDTSSGKASFNPPDGAARKVMKVYSLKTGMAVRVAIKKF